MRGWIIPIGGKLLAPDILERFIALSGGSRARIAVIPTASNEPDMGTFYERVFERHGVEAVKSLRLERRSDCDDADWMEWLGDATGVFFYRREPAQAFHDAGRHADGEAAAHQTR